MPLPHKITPARSAIAPDVMSDMAFDSASDAAKADHPAAPQTATQRAFIAGIELYDFRSYERAHCVCESEIVVLTGDNGTGKTNILEALSLLNSGRGLRSATLADMAREGGSGGWSLSLHVMMEGEKRHINMAYAPVKEGRILRLDGERLRGFDMLAQACPQLWLTPSMDRLFSDGATARRKFFDRFVAALVPQHSQRLSSFEKAMRERNRLLQDGGAGAHHSWLDGLEMNMAELALPIVEARLRALDVLSANLHKNQHPVLPPADIALHGRLEAAMRNQPAGVVEDEYRGLLADQRALDATAGRTLEGPHRSDLHITHRTKNMPAAQCSTGEQKALLVGLVLAQARTLGEESGVMPVLLLDEVTAHLDEMARAALFETICDLKCQSWLTGTDRQIFAPLTTPYAHHYKICDGQIHNA